MYKFVCYYRVRGTRKGVNENIKEIVIAEDAGKARRMVESRHAGDPQFRWGSYPQIAGKV